ncbi:YcxB family protein [Alistipes sp.]|uniref:YcxB family protein n=1 Tax=Alistipes sp. TaxID=1872444 RepID=UPI000E91CD71|nr:YcxB family protein [Alistipes sp.]HBX90852.1 hypothetical protein [Alistipes sp.]HCN13880.1 hypothetical protein [Alistipes sp.]
MEQPRFECRFRHERALLREVFRAYRRWWQPAFFVYAAVMAVLLLCQAVLWREPVSATSVAFCIACATIGFCASPRRQAIAAERQHRRRFDGELPEVTAAFSDGEILLRERRDEQHFDYAQVERIRRRGPMTLLVLRGRLTIPLPDAGFTKGDAASFGAFIRARCPEAKTDRR